MPRTHAPQRESTAMRSPCTATKSSSRSLQLEKACTHQRRPNAAKNKINFKKYIWIECLLCASYYPGCSTKNNWESFCPHGAYILTLGSKIKKGMPLCSSKCWDRTEQEWGGICWPGETFSRIWHLATWPETWVTQGSELDEQVKEKDILEGRARSWDLVQLGSRGPW